MKLVLDHKIGQVHLKHDLSYLDQYMTYSLIWSQGVFE